MVTEGPFGGPTTLCPNCQVSNYNKLITKVLRISQRFPQIRISNTCYNLYMPRLKFFYVEYPDQKEIDVAISSYTTHNVFSLIRNLFTGSIFSFTPQFGDRPEGEGIEEEPFYSDQIGIE